MFTWSRSNPSAFGTRPKASGVSADIVPLKKLRSGLRESLRIAPPRRSATEPSRERRRRLRQRRYCLRWCRRPSTAHATVASAGNDSAVDAEVKVVESPSTSMWRMANSLLLRPDSAPASAPAQPAASPGQVSSGAPTAAIAPAALTEKRGVNERLTAASAGSGATTVVRTPPTVSATGNLSIRRPVDFGSGVEAPENGRSPPRIPMNGSGVGWFGR